jgi:hypothetical protein
VPAVFQGNLTKCGFDRVQPGRIDCPSSFNKLLSVDQSIPTANNRKISSDGPSSEHDASDKEGV